MMDFRRQTEAPSLVVARFFFPRGHRHLGSEEKGNAVPSCIFSRLKSSSDHQASRPLAGARTEVRSVWVNLTTGKRAGNCHIPSALQSSLTGRGQERK